MPILRMLCLFIAAFLRGRLDLAAENIALRQQLAVLHRSARRLPPPLPYPSLDLTMKVYRACRCSMWRGGGGTANVEAARAVEGPECRFQTVHYVTGPLDTRRLLALERA